MAPGYHCNMKKQPIPTWLRFAGVCLTCLGVVLLISWLIHTFSTT